MSDKSVKDVSRLVTPEQLRARVTPKQATPFFVDKLTQLCSHLGKKLRNSDKATDRFVITCDQAHFKLAFLVKIDLGTWDRFVPQILHFPTDDDFFFNHIWGKT